MAEPSEAGALAPIDPDEVPAAAPAPALLQHVRHESVMLEQLRLMREGYATALAGLQVEYDGNERLFSEVAQEREADYEAQKIKAEELHVRAQSDLLKRLDDLRASIKRLDAALALDTLGGEQ